MGGKVVSKLIRSQWNHVLLGEKLKSIKKRLNNTNERDFIGTKSIVEQTYNLTLEKSKKGDWKEEQ